jgi:casein kinase II subunit beta
MFCEVERSYIEDGFNLYGLRACVSNFSDCLDLILDRIGPDDSDDSHLTQSACTLYGLIHARYIITAHGLDAMYNKVRTERIRAGRIRRLCELVGAPASLLTILFLRLIASQYAAKDFGTCPLVQCGSQPVLPVGLKDEMGAETVKIFCPKCNQVFHPPPVRSRPGNASGVDGAAFGTTFPHLFLMTFSNLVPDPLPAESAYVPRVFGFRVYKSAQRRNSSSLPGALVPAASAAAAGSPSQQQPTLQRKESIQAGAQQEQPPKQEPTEQDDRPPAPVGSTTKTEKAEAQGNASSTGSASASALKTPPSAPAGDLPTTSAAAPSEPPGYANNDSLPGAEAGGEDALGASQPIKSPRSGKRKKDGDNASTATSTDNNAAASDQKQQPGGPTFLMETTSKRRRKTNGGT